MKSFLSTRMDVHDQASSPRSVSARSEDLPFCQPSTSRLESPPWPPPCSWICSRPLPVQAFMLARMSFLPCLVVRVDSRNLTLDPAPHLMWPCCFSRIEQLPTLNLEIVVVAPPGLAVESTELLSSNADATGHCQSAGTVDGPVCVVMGSQAIGRRQSRAPTFQLS